MKMSRYYKVAGIRFSVISDNDSIIDGLENYKPFEDQEEDSVSFEISVEPFIDTNKELYFNEVIENDAPMISVFLGLANFFFTSAMFMPPLSLSGQEHLLIRWRTG